MSDLDYWEECISYAAEDCGLSITSEQLTCLAARVSSGHEDYGMAFYSPPDSDRYNEIEREWERKYKNLQADFSKYQRNAETAVKQALGQYGSASISIGEYGEVLKHDGRTTKLQ